MTFPNIFYASALSKMQQFAPSNAWHETAEWLKSNTPEPYNETYLKQFTRPYQRLDSGYGIVSHWDYGYWITQMAHRSPIINPGITESRISVANYMLGIKDIYSVRDSKYVILTSETAMASGKYWSWVEYAGLDWHDYFDFYYIPSGELKILYYPEYYKSLIVRLYNFEGKRVVGQEPTVVTYRQSGKYKKVLDAQQFSTYEEAIEYVNKNKDCRIVSIDPFLSPVSMPEASDYNLVFSTENRVRVDNMLVSEVKIFERVR
uniref:AglB-like core domain-containing protein n=1 Tax=viral metagenome TaxID=1070528 RepID=A0A6M3LHF2_9ZZZZ